MVTMVSVGVEAPSKHVDATTKTNLYHGFLSVTNIVFAYGELFLSLITHFLTIVFAETRDIAGHVAFFGFIAEMRVPEDYPKTMYLLQLIDTSMYLVSPF